MADGSLPGTSTATKLDRMKEKFVRAIHQGDSASEALRKANPKALKWKPETVYSEASRYKADPKVSARLQELQAEARAQHEVTIERLTEMLIEDRSQAKELDQPATAVTAVMGLAKLHGLIVDKSQSVNLNLNFEDILRARLSRAGGAPNP